MNKILFEKMQGVGVLVEVKINVHLFDEKTSPPPNYYYIYLGEVHLFSQIEDLGLR